MKKFLLILLTATAFYGCKDDGAAPLSAFEKVTLSVIAENSSKMNANDIEFASSAGMVTVDDVLIFKTAAGIYGKIKIVSMNDVSPGPLTIDVVNYNSDGSVKLEKKGLVIPSSGKCDLDTQVQTSDLNAVDFQLYSEITSFGLRPKTGAVFYVYSN